MVHLQLADVRGDPGDLLGPQPGHQRVVVGLVADVAGPVLLLEPPDHVLEPLRCRAAPTAERGARRAGRAGSRRRRFGRGGEPRVDLGEVGGVRHSPRLGRVGEEGVGEQDHRRAVGHRDARRLEHRVEALGRRRRRDDRERRLAVAAVERHQEVGRLGLGRHSGRGPRSLDVDHEQGELESGGEPDRLLLQVHAGAARGGDPQMAAEGRAQRHVGGRDLVLGLDGSDPEALVARELVQELGRRGDRVAGEEQRQAAANAGRDQPEGRGGGAVDARGRCPARPGPP